MNDEPTPTGNDLIAAFERKDALPVADGGYPGGVSPTLGLLRSLPEHVRASEFVPAAMDRIAGRILDGRGIARARIIHDVEMMQRSRELGGP